MGLLQLFAKESDRESFVSTFKDPFKSDKVESVRMNIHKGYFDKSRIEFKACVYFENGATKGEHNITADDFNSLVGKVESFIKTL